MAQSGPQQRHNSEGVQSPRARRATLKRRARWLLAGGSAVLAIGIYVGLAFPAPFSGGDDLVTAAVAHEEQPTGSTQISASATDETPATPAVSSTDAAPASRSRGS